MGNAKQELLLLIVVIQLFGIALLWHQQNALFVRLHVQSSPSKSEHSVVNNRTNAARLEDTIADSRAPVLRHSDSSAASTSLSARENPKESDHTSTDTGVRHPLKQNYSALLENLLDAYEQRKEHDEMMAELDAPVHTLPIDPGLDEPMLPDSSDNSVQIFDI